MPAAGGKGCGSVAGSPWVRVRVCRTIGGGGFKLWRISSPVPVLCFGGISPTESMNP